MKIIDLIKCSCVTLFFYSPLAFSASLVIEDGILLGATNIDINGVAYDVSFVDGSCIDLFNSCDNNSDFFFQDVTLGQQANLALLEQVLIDTSSGAFDSFPALTNGCKFSGFCSIYTPVSVETGSDIFGANVAVNHQLDSLDGYTGIQANVGLSSDFSLGNELDNKTYAIWSQTATVPVPPAFLLFASGLIGLAGVRRTQRAKH